MGPFVAVVFLVEVFLLIRTLETFHSRHHRLYVPFAFGALYNHWFEGLLMDTIGAGLGYKLSGMGIRGGMIFFSFSTMKTVDDHCGYALPWDPLQKIFWNNAGYHDVHHQSWGIKVRGPEGGEETWDKLTPPADQLLAAVPDLLGPLARYAVDGWRRVGTLRRLPRTRRRRRGKGPSRRTPSAAEGRHHEFARERTRHQRRRRSEGESAGGPGTSGGDGGAGGSGGGATGRGRSGGAPEEFAEEENQDCRVVSTAVGLQGARGP